MYIYIYICIHVYVLYISSIIYKHIHTNMKYKNHQENLHGVIKTKNNSKEKINKNLKKLQKKQKINCNLRCRSRLVILLFYYKIKRLLKRFVDVLYSITEFKRKVFVLSVKVLLPYSFKWVSTSCFMDRGLGLIVLTFCWRDCLLFLKFNQWSI